LLANGARWYYSGTLIRKKMSKSIELTPEEFDLLYDVLEEARLCGGLNGEEHEETAERILDKIVAAFKE
jgi:hypothetical protein